MPLGQGTALSTCWKHESSSTAPSPRGCNVDSASTPTLTRKTGSATFCSSGRVGDMARRVAGKKQSDRWLRCRQTDQKRSVLSRGDVRPYLDPGRLVLEVFVVSPKQRCPRNNIHWLTCIITYCHRCCSGVRLLCGLTLKRCVLAVGLRAYARDRDGNKVKIVLTSTRMHMSQLWSWKLPCHVTAAMTTWAADTIYSLLCGSSPRERSGVQVVSLPGASSVVSWVPSLSDKTQRVCPVLAATQYST